jgi:5-deoxy-glucuronate isomerase
MHRDTGEIDTFETLCSIPQMTVSRLRIRRTLKVEGLKEPGTESALASVSGAFTVTTAEGVDMRLEEKDVCYLPVETEFALEASGPADVLWARAPGAEKYGPYVKKFSEVTPVVSGAQSYTRHIYTLLGEKDPANRLIVGFVEGDPGNWTSFPPHRHDGKPEVYVYYGMSPRFGVQVVAGKDDLAYLVRDGDAVLFEQGYHPNVATPGVGMKFVWIISADPKERNLAVEFHPDYKDMPMGPTHLSTK